MYLSPSVPASRMNAFQSLLIWRGTAPPSLTRGGCGAPAAAFLAFTGSGVSTGGGGRLLVALAGVAA